MTYTQNRQLDKFGIAADVILMDFIIKSGRVEAKLPTGLMNRQDLDLSQEGVKSKNSITDIFKATWQGEPVNVLDHRGDEITLVKPGEEVSLQWGRNKLVALCQWLQDLGEFVSRKDGWMFSKEDLPEVMARVEFIERRCDQIRDILIACHADAQDAYNARVEAIIFKLEIALNKDYQASSALVRQESESPEGLSRETRLRHQRIERQLNGLPEYAADLRGRFPSIAELRSGFIFSNTTPKELPSVLSQVQGNAAAVKALVEAETAEQGQAYGRAIRNGINLMSETIREKAAEMSDQFYGHIASCLSDLEDLGDSRKFGEKVRGRVEKHLERLGVLSRLLAGFNALQQGEGTIDQVALMQKVQEFQAAFDMDAKQGNGCGEGRKALLERLDAFRKELSGTVLSSNLHLTGDGGEALADWVEAGFDETPFNAQAPITEEGAQVDDLALML